MSKKLKGVSLAGLQKLIEEIYGVPDDRLYSIEDMLTHQQRFAMRSLKGIRKGDLKKIKLNLMIALSWLLAISNRFHIEVDDVVWKRFPGACLYCGEKTCECKRTKLTKRKTIRGDLLRKPKTLNEWQLLFNKIYPASGRTLDEAGVHFAEEVGEVSESVHNYLGQHLKRQFSEIQDEIADEISCIFGIANSAGIDVVTEVEKMYSNGCHVCARTPCVCDFAKVSLLKT
ncbi:MAG: hypothetical protein NUW00_02515 [Candidatus Kaiserbacteria bacterium]|nr:hypothetical protein [Candidatus Kaiserbacteria bacterium]